jgi:hypothetical protein
MWEAYHEVADFLAVYISEAHATNEWPLGRRVCIAQHETIEERIAAAQSYRSDMAAKVPMVVDTMSNSFNSQYNVWPERLFIINNGVVEYVADLYIDQRIPWLYQVLSYLKSRFPDRPFVDIAQQSEY